jgi:hypothetical protein
VSEVDLSTLPLFVTTKQLQTIVGFSPKKAAEVKRLCGRVHRVGRSVYVYREDLARVLREAEVRVS